MMHHSTSGRIFIGERIPLHCQVSLPTVKIKLYFKIELVCVQDWKDSESRKSRPGFHFPARGSGVILLPFTQPKFTYGFFG